MMDGSSVVPKRARGGQSSIEFAQPTPRDPSTVPCEWCGEPSVTAIEAKKPVGTFMYVCANHEDVAKAANARRKS